MQQRTRNWILGLLCIILVSVIWIAASFVVQSVVDSGISPFLISYICNSLFVVYIPLVELTWLIQRRYVAKTGKEDGKGSSRVDDKFNLTNADKAKLLEAASASSSESEADGAAETTKFEIEELHISSSDDETSESSVRRVFSRRETAKISALICPIWFLAQYTFNLSLKYTTVTSNTILSSTSTLFTFLISVAFVGETFTVLKVLSIVLCMAGSVTVAFGDSESISEKSAPRPVLGDVICLISAVFYACYTNLIRKKFPDEATSKEEVSTALFLGYLGLFNAILFSPVVLILHFTGVEPVHRFSTRQIGLIIGKGMFDNVLSDYLWAKAVVLTTATVATAGLTLQVPIAAVVDTLRGHAPGRLNVVGAVAVLAGFFGISQPSGFCKNENGSSPEPPAEPKTHDIV